MSMTKTSRWRLRWRPLVWAVAGLSLAVALLAVMFIRLDITLLAVRDQLAGVPLWGVPLIVTLSLVIFGLSAFQWRLTLAATAQDEALPPFSRLWLYTALGGVLGQFVPVQLSMVMVRSFMLRMQGQATLTRGGATSLLEQGIALWVPLLLSVPALLAINGQLSFAPWIAASLGMLALGWAVLYLTTPFLATHLDPARHPGWWRLPLLRFFGGRLREIAAMKLFDRAILVALYRLALVRSVFLAARILLFMHLLNLELSVEDAFYIVPLAQVMQLFNLTPGNLGVREWTWIGLLTLSGVDSDMAGQYVLAQRVLLFTSLVITWLVMLLIASADQQRHKPVQPAPKEAV